MNSLILLTLAFMPSFISHFAC